ncbi:MAG: hypothetical protein LBO80_11200 [Treponema sp.]|jgi:hypothetical protein|nr:hypothetical protein [Treponema sp.]
MASEKDPSIYTDRSTIGSSDELDEYGVWVKSEPQDLSSASAETLPEIEDLPDFDAAFDIESAGGGEEAAGNFGDSLEENDFEFESLPEEEPLETDAAGSGSFDESAFTEVSLNDFLTDGEDLEETAAEDSEFRDSDSIPDLEFDQTESLEEDVLEEDTKEEIIKEKVMPDFDSAGTAGAEPEAAPRNPPDLSTQLLMKIADELSSIKKELSSLKTEFSVIRRESPAGSKEGGFFDEEDDEKIALTGDELDNILNTADFTEETGSDATGAVSGDFGAMETGEAVFPSEEPAEPPNLSDQPDIITGEDFEPEDLNGGEIKFDEADVDEIGGEYGGEETPSRILDPQEFDITLDASILGDDPALANENEVSGKEASGKEASGKEAQEEAETGVQEEALPGFNEDTEEPEEITIDLSDDFTDTLDLESKDSDELKTLREQGAEPLTEAPEDISYLETEPLQEEDGHIDLSGAVIDEPDLSAGITENPIEEPSLDGISLDLDMEDDGLEDSGFSIAEDGGDLSFEEDKELEVSIPEEESVLDIPPEEESFDQIVSDDLTAEADETGAVPPGGDLDFENDAGEPEAPGEPEALAAPAEDKLPDSSLPVNLKQELKTVLTYMDQLLESLPEDKIEEFAKSEYFDTYKKLFEELGLV